VGCLEDFYRDLALACDWVYDCVCVEARFYSEGIEHVTLENTLLQSFSNHVVRERGDKMFCNNVVS
jgi:hypothetical protein